MSASIIAKLEFYSSSPSNHHSRRKFLTVAGSVSLGATVSGVAIPNAQASNLKSEVPSLSSISDFKLTRDEHFDVPGGKELFVEWQVSDEKGITKKFIVHHTRVDADVTYTVSTNVVIHTYAVGTSLSGDPDSTSEQNITVYAVKGDIVGLVRNDHMTITTVHRDGSTNRQSQVVPVKVGDTAFADMDTATILKQIGGQFIGTHS